MRVTVVFACLIFLSSPVALASDVRDLGLMSMYLTWARATCGGEITAEGGRQFIAASDKNPFAFSLGSREGKEAIARLVENLGEAGACEHIQNIAPKEFFDKPPKKR